MQKSPANNGSHTEFFMGEIPTTELLAHLKDLKTYSPLAYPSIPSSKKTYKFLN